MSILNSAFIKETLLGKIDGVDAYEFSGISKDTGAPSCCVYTLSDADLKDQRFLDLLKSKLEDAFTEIQN